jgi:hypothetical protein
MERERKKKVMSKAVVTQVYVEEKERHLFPAFTRLSFW